MRNGKHRFQLVMPADLWRRAALIARQQKRPLTHLINEAITNYVTQAERGNP